MKKIQKFFRISLARSTPRSLFGSCILSSFPNTQNFNSFSFENKQYFAKIGKKKAEKIEKEKEKAKSELPDEIDLNFFEDSLKQEVENYKVIFYL